MGFNTGLSEDDVEEIRREYELEIGVLEEELATLRAENERMRAKLRQIQSLSSFASAHDLGEIAKEALK